MVRKGKEDERASIAYLMFIKMLSWNAGGSRVRETGGRDAIDAVFLFVRYHSILYKYVMLCTKTGYQEYHHHQENMECKNWDYIFF